MAPWHAGDGIARPSGHPGLVIGVPGDPRQAGELLDGLGEAGTVAPRSREPEGGHPHEHGFRVDPLDPFPAEPEIVEDTGREVLDHRIAPADQTLEDLDALLRS